MTNAEKKTRVASALFDLTDRESLTWEEFRPDAAELPDDLPAAEGSAVFAALHDEMDLYLYREAGEGEDATPRLEVADPERGAGWQFPEMDAVEDLYELVQFRAAGLEDWMDQVIAEAEGAASGEEGSGEETSDDAEDPVPSWADDAIDGAGDPPSDADDSAGEADEEAAAEDTGSSDEAVEDESGPDMLGGVNGTEGEKEFG